VPIKLSISADQLVSAGLITSLGSPDLLGDLSWYVSHFDDLYLAFAQERFYAPLGARKARDLVGLRPISDRSYTVFHSVKPGKFDSLIGPYGFDNYGSNLGSLVKFFNILSGNSKDSIPSYRRESSLRHSTYSGELVSLSPLYETDDYVIPELEALGSFRAYLNRRWSALYQGGDVIPVAHARLSGVSIRDVCERFSKTFYTRHVNLPSNGVDVTYENVSYTIESNYVLVKWTCVTTWINHPGQPAYNDVLRWTVRAYFPYGDIAGDTVPVDMTEYETTHLGYPSVIIGPTFDGDPSDGLDGFSTKITFSGDLYTQYTFLSVPSVTTTTDEAEAKWVDSGYVLARARQNWTRRIDASWIDITPSATFSSVDAFRTMEGSLGLSSLRTLSRLPELGELIPDFREAVHQCMGILGVGEPPSLGDVLDLASRAYLKSLTVGDAYKLITITVPKIVSLVNQFWSPTKLAIGHGSFSFEFPFGTFGRDKTTLVTRSKIVMDTTLNSVASSLLDLDAVGLLPKPSVVFKFLPFHFICDWIGGVTASIERAEYTLALASVPAYYVHTYEFISPFTQTELEEWRFSSLSSQPAALRVYNRDISVFCPTVKDSKFGFGLPSGFPPLGTLGAVLYQLLF